MSEANYDWKFRAGDTPTWRVTVTGADLNLPGTVIECVAKGPGVLIRKSTDTTGVQITDASHATIALAAADTLGLDNRRLRYVVELTEPTGAVTTMIAGDWFIEEDIG